MAIILQELPAEAEPKPEPKDLAGRAQKLLRTDSADTVWRQFRGLPAKDGHPGLGFKGHEDFTPTMAGSIELSRDPEVEGGYLLTLWPEEGKIGRPISQKSIPEITGGDDSQQFDALQVAFEPGEEVYSMRGIVGDEIVRVEGLYGEGPQPTRSPDAEMFAIKLLDALEAPGAQLSYSAHPGLGAHALHLASK